MSQAAAPLPAGGAPKAPPVPFGMGKPLLDTRGPIILVGFFAMIVGMFMAILDIQIVAASLSQIQAGLSASPEEVSWVQTSYLIAEVVMIPLSGYLSRMMSTRLLFTCAAAGFTFSSFMCGFASSIEEMMVWRAVQGFIGGAMIPTVFATSYMVFGMQRRAASSAFVGLVVTLAPTIGPTLGGYITDLMSWHWLFFINVVPGIVVTALVWNFMDIDEADWSLWKNLDWVGLALLAIFLGTFQYALEEGAKNDWLQDFDIRNLAAVAVIAGTLFFYRMLTHKNPIVDLSPLTNRNFAVGTIMAFIVGVGLFGITYILPLYLGRVRSFSSLQIGEWLWVTGAFMFMTAPTVGMLAARIDLRWIAASGFALLLVSALLFRDITLETSFWDMFLPQALRGVGLMATMMGVQTMAMQGLSPTQIKGASGLFNLFRNTGGAFGLAVLNTQLSERIYLHWWRLRDSLQAGDPQAQAFLDGFAARYATTMPADDQQAALKVLNFLTLQQAQIMAYADLFQILAFGFGLAALLMLVLKKPAYFVSEEVH